MWFAADRSEGNGLSISQLTCLFLCFVFLFERGDGEGRHTHTHTQLHAHTHTIARTHHTQRHPHTRAYCLYKAEFAQLKTGSKQRLETNEESGTERKPWQAGQ